MIRVKAFTKLLSDNADGKLVRRWFMTTPNGSLLAYTSPTDIRELRDQVALISMTWKEQLDLRENDMDDEGHTDPNEPTMHTMTMEFENRNIVVRLLQANLLLVLEGGVPPRKPRQVQVTTEGPRDQRYPPHADGAVSKSVENGSTRPNGSVTATEPPGSPSGHSEASTTMSVRKAKNVLDVHRRKLDAMTTIIRSELRKIHFEMPSDPEGRHF
ncbi:hypothetical protein BDZ85DRAFT_281061 [Elsinoe ampelina]|uniref:Uncharacterized protein n=1 Tax=Elsinoe ampelina TaxID=302913 RepID=A0A6A6GFG3_9PEZI|nr:hypothetical protein BDZ85DRAFT_281061 [Elsinoe ampelina]